MLAVARRIRPDLRWQHGDACALPFGDDSFDLVLSQAGLMFFGDRVAALREMGRVAGGRGRVAVQVPGRLSASPGYRALADVVARHAGPEARDLLGAYFSVGEPDLLTHLIDAAGLRVEVFDTWLGATRLDSVDTFLAVELLPLADRLDQGIRDRIVEDCQTALAPFVDAAGAIDRGAPRRGALSQRVVGGQGSQDRPRSEQRGHRPRPRSGPILVTGGPLGGLFTSVEGCPSSRPCGASVKLRT
jgi:SAM-dependent methyltransferase